VIIVLLTIVFVILVPTQLVDTKHTIYVHSWTATKMMMTTTIKYSNTKPKNYRYRIPVQYNKPYTGTLLSLSWMRCHYHQPNQYMITSTTILKGTNDNIDDADRDYDNMDKIPDQIDNRIEKSNNIDDTTTTTSDVTTTTTSTNMKNKNMERAWRYSKKPLISIGAQKGPTIKHGNSLHELLQFHTAVKVKVQLLLSSKTNNNEETMMMDIYQQLKQYAIQSGASNDIELIQLRTSPERILYIGLPNTIQCIQNGTFPPVIPEPLESTTLNEQ
jgi:hypothetical protein